MEALLYLFIVLLFILELAAIFIPLLPDSIFFWTAVISYRLIIPESEFSLFFYTGAVIITVLVFLANYLSNAYFVKRQGGSNKTVIAAGLGIFLGALLLGPLGFIIGPFILIFVVEYWQSKNRDNAFRLALSSLSAFFASTLARFLMQLFLIIWFFIEIF
ncbi:DUF456 family protein [Halanaerobium sp. Z-7514]|uniref:DUF456 family protein n=1 Tax=Halanaerobium polyolivorans TaxID=2886943 RepID=A0AAW4X053_9FIRM|nr:DUF456 domain-containing protein [Halanaerobium polyolivorans]MCC3145006.1 DUF456 family protein [Halanaerobium polyolivorans]RQD73183.1 MAG: DUF456 family protein [Halanaerobium sp. MSAO_Bac5]